MSSQEQLQDSGNSFPGAIKSRSPSPHPYPQFSNPSPAQSLDPSSMAATFSSTPFTNPNPVPTSPESYGYNPNYLSATPVSQSLAPPEQNVTQGLSFSPQFAPGFANQVEQQSTLPLHQESYSNLLNSNQSDYDFSLYQNPSPNSSTAPEYDSSLLLDPQVQRHQGVNPAELVSQISSSPHTSASPQITPQDQTFPQPSSPSPISPPSSAGPFFTPQHSRHTSLDPSTAAYLSGHSHPDWQAMMNNASFQGHRRAPSEVSDVSSAAHSPFMSQQESFDAIENNPSPLLAPQSDPSLYDNAMGIESFTLSDQHQQTGLSPAHSPYLSPQLMPQQGTDLVPNAPYISAPTISPQYPTPPTDVYGNEAEGMMAMAHGSAAPGDLGQASHMAPPSINVEFAPPSREANVGPSKPATDLDSLSPPSVRK